MKKANRFVTLDKLDRWEANMLPEKCSDGYLGWDFRTEELKRWVFGKSWSRLICQRHHHYHNCNMKSHCFEFHTVQPLQYNIIGIPTSNPITKPTSPKSKRTEGLGIRKESSGIRVGSAGDSDRRCRSRHLLLDGDPWSGNFDNSKCKTARDSGQKTQQCIWLQRRT